jgi:hypothetical protein
LDRVFFLLLTLFTGYVIVLFRRREQNKIMKFDLEVINTTTKFRVLVYKAGSAIIVYECVWHGGEFYQGDSLESIS